MYCYVNLFHEINFITILHSILAVRNLLAHNDISEICHCGLISLHYKVAVNSSFYDNLTLLGVSFILLVMVPYMS